MPSPSLPHPIARHLVRGRQAKSPFDRLECAWFAWEASLRLAVGARPPAEASSLARASLGQWAAAFGAAAEVPAGPLGALLVQRANRDARCASPLLAPLPGVGGHRPDGEDVLRAAVSLRLVMGRDPGRPARDLDEDAALLLGALAEAWDSGLFLPSGARLRWIGPPPSSGPHAPLVLVLSGPEPVEMDSKEALAAAPDMRRGLHLWNGDRWRPLEPWLFAVERRGGDERSLTTYHFRGLANADDEPEYVDFESGDVLRASALERVLPGARALARLVFEAREDASAGGSPVGRVGDFTPLERLGEGGMGVVHLARQESLGRLVALKTLKWAPSAGDELRRRFDREIASLARCQHQGIVRVLASGEQDGLPYYAMELVPGVDLFALGVEWRRGDGVGPALSRAARTVRAKLPRVASWFAAVDEDLPRETPDVAWRNLARLLASAARALAYLHTRGFVHRDVSPSNVMVSWPDGRAVLMDLGLAFDIDATHRLSVEGQHLVGTLPYCAPERLSAGATNDDPRSDIYSLAAVAYEVVTGIRPFPAEDVAGLLAAIPRDEVPFAHDVVPHMPADLAAVLHKGLERDPARRYATAADLADDLERFARGESVMAETLTTWYRLRSFARRRRARLWSAGAAAAALLLASLYFHDRGAAHGGSAVAADVRERLTNARAVLLESASEDKRAQVAVEFDALLAALDGFSPQRPAPDPRALAVGTRSGGATIAVADDRNPFLGPLEESAQGRAAADFLFEVLRMPEPERRAHAAAELDRPVEPGGVEGAGRRAGAGYVAALLSNLPEGVTLEGLATVRRVIWEQAALGTREGEPASSGPRWRWLADQLVGDPALSDLGGEALERWAETVEAQGDPAEARRAWEEVVAARASLSPGNKAARWPAVRLALLERGHGDLAASEERLRGVVEGWARRFGARDRDLLAVRAEWLATRLARGDDGEARELAFGLLSDGPTRELLGTRAEALAVALAKDLVRLGQGPRALEALQLGVPAERLERWTEQGLLSEDWRARLAGGGA